jgi:hypothetical protein
MAIAPAGSQFVGTKIKAAIAGINPDDVLSRVNEIEQQQPADVLKELTSKLKSMPTRSNGKSLKVAPLFAIEEEENPYSLD